MRKKNFTIPILITLAIIFVIVIIWLNSSGKTFETGSSKNSCDREFLQWCKDNPGVGDYDNFGNVKRECIGQGSYRTCDQVKEALS